MPVSKCGSSVTVYPPGQDPVDVPLDDFDRQLDESTGNEVWEEFSRTTSIVDVSGVEIERIEEVTFQKESGKMITLSFNN